MKLEFDKSHIIDRIVIYYMFYTNWFSFGFDKAKYIEWIDNRSNVDVSVYQGEVKQKSCGTLQLTYGLDQSDQIYTLICNTEGDTVKLSKFEDRIVVYELVVLALAGIYLGLHTIIHTFNHNYHTMYNNHTIKLLFAALLRIVPQKSQN